MKKALKIFGLLMMMVAFMPMASCGGDDEPDTNYAAQISGTYTGTMMSQGYVISDTYIVTISRVTDTMVTMRADFFSDGYANFNVSLSGNTYTLTSSDHTNMSIIINGNTMNVSFLNNAGTQTTFNGQRS